MITATDYAWLQEKHESLLEAYCVTLVEGLSPEQLLHTLGADSRSRVTGVAQLEGPSYDLDRDGWSFVGVTYVDGWALMIEYNGYLGVTDTAMLPLSRGRTVVSHYSNVNAADAFSWYCDGTVRVQFEPLFAHCRWGSHPDELLAEMRQAGFQRADGPDSSYDGHTEAAFALAHRLTGVAVTSDLFATADFLCGCVPAPAE